MDREQNQGQIGQHIDDAHALPEGYLRAISHAPKDGLLALDLRGQCTDFHDRSCAMDM